MHSEKGSKQEKKREISTWNKLGCVVKKDNNH
jgi:hypothetical protein